MHKSRLDLNWMVSPRWNHRYMGYVSSKNQVAYNPKYGCVSKKSTSKSSGSSSFSLCTLKELDTRWGLIHPFQTPHISDLVLHMYYLSTTLFVYHACAPPYLHSTPLYPLTSNYNVRFISHDILIPAWSDPSLWIFQPHSRRSIKVIPCSARPMLGRKFRNQRPLA